MYLINKNTAKLLLEKFSLERNFEKISPFASDWTITKIEKAAFAYPMLAVEKVYFKPEDDISDPQILFHMKNQRLHYDPKKYF